MAESIKQIFDSWAGRERGKSMAHNHEELFNAMTSGWTHHANAAVLDIACGNGFALELLAQKGYTELSGIDFSDKMIEEAGRLLPGAELVVGVMEKLPWSDGTFDRVYSIEALYYSTDTAKAATEMRRVLRPTGGLDIVIEYYGENKGSHAWADALGQELALKGEAEWAELFRDAGFEKIRTQRVVRERIRREEEFTADEFFPSYDLYVEFKKQGALHILNY